MTNKNSGCSPTFYSLILPLILLLCFPLAFTQICIQSSGSICLQCVPQYQLVNGQCLPLSPSLPNTPTLIFLKAPTTQKLLYNTLPVVVSIHGGQALNETQQNVINQFKVIPLSNSSLGNYYQLQTNLTLVNSAGIATSNSSIGKQANQPNNLTAISEAKQGNAGQKGLDVGVLTGTDSYTLGQLGNGSNSVDAKPMEIEPSFTAIPQAVQPNLIAIRQGLQPSLVQVKQKQPVGNQQDLIPIAEPPLTQIKQRIQVNLTQINEQPTVIAARNDSSSTPTPSNNSVVASSIPSSSSNSTLSIENSSALQLQLINQRLTQVGKASEPTFTQATLKQTQTQSQTSTQSPPSSNSSGTITLQLTEVGQQLTQINQQLIQLQLKQNKTTNQSSPLVQPVFSQSTNNETLLPVNLTRLSLISPPQLTQVNPSPALSSADLTWIKATRYQLYNLTLVPLSLTQVTLKPSSLSSNQSYTFKCTSTPTLFIPPSLKSTGPQLSYAQYSHLLLSKLSSQLKQHTLADRSTLCFDPPFQQAYQYLCAKYKSLGSTPILAAYYQFCGFSKAFRIYFIDDGAFPRITVRESSMVVDLFRMMPAQVFSSTYDTAQLAL